MKNLNGKVAVVTGAGSGIGRATAIELAKEGCLLAISDVNEKELETTRQTIESMGTKVHAKVLDVADKKAFHDYANEVAEEFEKVNIVINNAGVAVSATLENTSYEDFEWLMDINFWGMVYGTKVFLPHLKKSGEGHICNVSSVFGFMAPAGTGAYNASKFAIRGFNETLRSELDIEDCGVSLSSIHPGGIKTNIARDARMDQETLNDLGMDKAQAHAQFTSIAMTTPQGAAKTIVKGIKKNKMRILIGFDAHVIDWATRFTPILYRKLVTKLMKMGQARQRKIAAKQTNA
jgi:short-subunit dehydrogenase